jgi:hypothetical protein
MAKIKLGKWEVDEAELDREHEAAKRRGEESLKTEPQARAAFYDATNERLVIELKWGPTLSIPRHLVQGLRDADPLLVAKVTLLPRGAALTWAALDVDISVEGLLKGRYGTRKWMAQLEIERAATGPATAAKRSYRRRPRADEDRQAA